MTTYWLQLVCQAPILGMRCEARRLLLVCPAPRDTSVHGASSQLIAGKVHKDDEQLRCTNAYASSSIVPGAITIERGTLGPDTLLYPGANCNEQSLVQALAWVRHPLPTQHSAIFE